jgi:hypothetical protein
VQRNNKVLVIQGPSQPTADFASSPGAIQSDEEDKTLMFINETVDFAVPDQLMSVQ